MSSNKKQIDIGFEENMGLEPKELDEVRIMAQRFYDAGFSGGHQGLCWVASFLDWLFRHGHEIEYLEKPKPEKKPKRPKNEAVH